MSVLRKMLKLLLIHALQCCYSETTFSITCVESCTFLQLKKIKLSHLSDKNPAFYKILRTLQNPAIVPYPCIMYKCSGVFKKTKSVLKVHILPV